MSSHPRETLSVLSLLGFAGLALLRRWRRIERAEADRWLESVRSLLRWHDGLADGGRYPLREFSDAEGYDAWAATYDGQPNALIAREEAALQRLIGQAPRGRALDAACGTGRITAHLVAAGYQVTAVDRSGPMMARAQGKLKTVDFRAGALESLPGRDAEFDLATCCLALTHCDAIGPPIAELARVVRPGGRIILSDMHPVQTLLAGDASFWHAPGERGLIRNRFHAHSAYLDAFRAAGLVVRGCEEPTMTAEDVRTIFAAGGRGEQAPDILAISDAALIGSPMVLIWDLEKPG